MTRPAEKAHLYDPTGRFYAVPPDILQRYGYKSTAQVWLPAVSTILDIYQAPYLRKWYGIVGLTEAERRREQASAWGTQAHSLIEYIINGGKIKTWDGIEPEVQNCLRAWMRWVMGSKFKPAQAEMVVYSMRYGFAGMLDTVGHFGTRWGIADWKTGSREYPDPLKFLQIAAYYQAYHETHPSSPRVKEARLVGLNRLTGDCSELRRTARDLRHDFSAFRAALKLWQWVRAASDIEARDQAIREKGGTNAEEEPTGQEAARGQEGDGRGQQAVSAAQG